MNESKIDARDICLITPIDQNKDVLCWDGHVHRRFFEEESVRMVESWRKHGGWLKNIRIYVFNVNHAQISQSTIDKLVNFGCEYIVEDVDQYKEMGFLTEPLCGKLAEERVKEDVMIKIDLDMTLLRPLDAQLINQANDGILIEQYTDSDAKVQRNSIGNFNPFDTCFIISKKSHGFYQKYYDLCFSKDIVENPEWEKIHSETGNYFLEEFVVDYMYKNRICNIIPTKNHICGEGYISVDSMSPQEISTVRFFHSHIYMDSSHKDEFAARQQKFINEQRLGYMKKMCQILTTGSRY